MATLSLLADADGEGLLWIGQKEELWVLAKERYETIPPPQRVFDATIHNFQLSEERQVSWSIPTPGKPLDLVISLQENESAEQIHISFKSTVSAEARKTVLCCQQGTLDLTDVKVPA